MGMVSKVVLEEGHLERYYQQNDITRVKVAGSRIEAVEKATVGIKGTN